MSRLRSGASFALATSIVTGVALAWVVTNGGCAVGTNEEFLGNLEGGPPDGASAIEGSVLPSKDAESDAEAGPGQSGACGKVVVNEVLPEGPSNSEFIELFNPGSCAVALEGWSIKYKSQTGANGGANYTFTAGESIEPDGFFVVATATYAGNKDATFAGGLGNGGGQVGLLDDGATLIDAVGYGATTAGLYTENTPVDSPPANKSIARTPDGADTDDNANDFASATPTPGAPN